MKFKRYLEILQSKLEEKPQIGEAEVVYSRDDEGNGYQQISEDYFFGLAYMDLDGYHAEMIASYEEDRPNPTEEEKDDEGICSLDDVNVVIIN